VPLAGGGVYKRIQIRGDLAIDGKAAWSVLRRRSRMVRAGRRVDLIGAVAASRNLPSI
jgi:hypothetical protein